MHAQWFACLPDAEAAMAAYEGQGQGRRPRLWRYHAVRYPSVAATRRIRRARRGRPAKLAPPPLESGYRLVIEVEALANAAEDNGWMGLATTLGLLVYRVLQRQVRLYLHTHDQQIPGNKGLTATPTAAVVLALFTQVALVQFWIDEQEVPPLSGVQAYHLLVCNALGLDSSWYAVPSAQKNGRDSQTP